MNDIDVREFLASVAAGPEPAVGLDATRAMSDGQRSVRRKRLGAVVSVAAAAILVTGVFEVMSNRSGENQSAPVTGKSNSAPVVIRPFTIDDGSGSAFAASVLTAVQQVLPGATVSVVRGTAELEDWGGPVFGAEYSAVDNGVRTSIFVEVGASAAGYSYVAHPTTCAIAGPKDVCSVVDGAELRTIAAHDAVPAASVAVVSDVVVRWVAGPGTVVDDPGNATALALAAAVRAAMPKVVVSAPAGPTGTELIALQTWDQARALLAVYGATTWPVKLPYSNDNRVPAIVRFSPPGGGTVGIYAAEPTEHQALPAAPSGSVVATTGGHGVSYRVWATGGYLDQTQAQGLANLLAGLSASAPPAFNGHGPVPTPRRAQLEQDVLALTASEGSKNWIADETCSYGKWVVACFSSGKQNVSNVSVQIGSAPLPPCTTSHSVATGTCTRTHEYGRDVTVTQSLALGVDRYQVDIRRADGKTLKVVESGARDANNQPTVPLTLQQSKDLANALAATYL